MCKPNVTDWSASILIAADFVRPSILRCSLWPFESKNVRWIPHGSIAHEIAEEREHGAGTDAFKFQPRMKPDHVSCNLIG